MNTAHDSTQPMQMAALSTAPSLTARMAQFVTTPHVLPEAAKAAEKK